MVKIILKCHGTIVGGLMPLNIDRDGNKLIIHVYTEIGEVCPADISVSCSDNSSFNSIEVPLFSKLGFIPELFPEMVFENENENVLTDLRTGMIICKNNKSIRPFTQMAAISEENDNYKFLSFDDLIILLNLKKGFRPGPIPETRLTENEFTLSELISKLKDMYKDEPIDLHLLACLTEGPEGIIRQIKGEIEDYEQKFLTSNLSRLLAGGVTLGGKRKTKKSKKSKKSKRKFKKSKRKSKKSKRKSKKSSKK